MISYAQNFEDVVLDRVFKNVRLGNYIDVGAYDPVEDSVTKTFYDRGWSGINVEPVKTLYQKLVHQRPRDQNMNVAVGRHAGQIEFHEWVGTGLSSVIPSAHEQLLWQKGFQKETSIVLMTTLEEIAKTLGGKEVDFLKIDVEGAEREVLLGANWTTFRPRVIVIEAIRFQPESDILHPPQPSWPEWEPILLQNHYTFALFDGLNRFYHRAEEPELHALLSYPANVNDLFSLGTTHWLSKPTRHKRSLKRWFLRICRQWSAKQVP